MILLFLLLVFPLQSAAEVSYPWKNVYIGALDAYAWAGLVLAPHRDSVFAFRIRIKKGEDFADGQDLLFLAAEVGPHSPDGRYARMKYDLSLPFGKNENTPILKKPAPKSDVLTLEWSRQDEWTVIGKISAPKNIEIQLIHYLPWNFKGIYQLQADGHIKGESRALQNYHYLFWVSRPGTSISNSQAEEMTISFSTEKKREVFFIAGIDEDAQVLRNRIYRYKNERTIDSFLKEEARIYQKRRVEVRGLHKGTAEALTNNLFWMTLYQPGEHRFYTPAGRRWLFPKPDGSRDYWTIFEWDSFLNALELSVESSKHAVDVVTSVLETQYPNGNIPNWRGEFGGTPDRSQPPVGAFTVLKLFQKIGDLELLRFSYPYLTRWHAFWKAPLMDGRIRRDGNGDGLLEWGSDQNLVSLQVPEWEQEASGKQRAQWESGQDDLPNWDEAEFDDYSGTMAMNCLDLNCLYALDAWCLSEIAKLLNFGEDQAFFLSEYESMKELINDTFWNSQEGFYFDRHWDGSFSRKKAASNFYPLIARIPDENRARRMVRRLLDEQEYWGEYVIPTISRDDPEFKKQQYWKGAIWPPTNYLIYQGLKAYEFDVEAYEFSRKSAELFMRSWEYFQLCPENFNSQTGEAGGQRYQSWGPLFALIAIEEYIDITPWEGFRFGILQPEKGGELKRIAIQGRHYDVKVKSGEVKLKEEGKEIVRTNGGAVFRRFLYSENEVSFEVMSLVTREIRVRLLVKGKYQVIIDGQLREIFDGDSHKFRVPEGKHTVLILLIEKER